MLPTKSKRRLPFLQNVWPSWMEANDLFNDEFFTKKRELPAMNVKELEKTIEIELAMPGFSKKQIDVTVEGDLLHVLARNEKETVAENEEGYTRKEFSYNGYERYIPLPTNVKSDVEVKANFQNGLLKLEFEKEIIPEKENLKKIKIH